MTPVYERTFVGDFYAIWGSTEFRNEVPLLALYRAISCWVHNSDIGIEDRRRLVKNWLSAWFPVEKTTDLMNKVDGNLYTDNQLIFKILNNINTIYQSNPTRVFANLTDAQKLYIEKILQDISIDIQMEEALNLAWLLGEVLIRPRQRNGIWSLEVIPRDMYRIKYADNGDIQEIWIPYQKKNEANQIETLFHVWTPEYYVQLDQNGERQAFELNGENIDIYEHRYFDKNGNPTTPFVIISMNYSEDIYGGAQWELIRDILNLSLVEYLIQENLVYGTAGFWFAKNLANYGKETSISLSPSKLIHVTSSSIDEPEPDIEHKNANFLALELLEFKRQYETLILKKYGIPNSMLSDQPGNLSGVAMLIDRLELMELTKKLEAKAKDVEAELIEKIIAVNNAELTTKLPQNIDFSISFGETNLYYEKDKEIEIYDALFERGLISPKEYVKKLVGKEFETDEKAIEYIQTNKEISNGIRAQTGSGDITGNAVSTAEPTPNQ